MLEMQAKLYSVFTIHPPRQLYMHHTKCAAQLSLKTTSQPDPAVSLSAVRTWQHNVVSYFSTHASQEHMSINCQF